MVKRLKVFALTLLMSFLVFAALSASNINVQAQGQATVAVLDSIGGTVSPSGTSTHADGSSVTFTATPSDMNSVFQYFVIYDDSAATIVTDNPATITVSGGHTYAVQAVFNPVLPAPGSPGLPSDMSNAAVVIVLASAGGTTTPGPGTYALADATSLELTAHPADGFVFSHWVISGSDLATGHGDYPFTSTPTDNPYNVNHGYGNSYSYQAVFQPVGTTEPTPSGGSPGTTGTPSGGGGFGGLSMDVWWAIIAGIVILAVLLIAWAIYSSRRRRYRHPNQDVHGHTNPDDADRRRTYADENDKRP
jgi:hypothetical protein